MKFYKNFIIFWSVLYIAIALLGRLFHEKKEVFPFFRWSLYSRSDAQITLPYVLVTKAGTQIFDAPKNLTILQEFHYLDDVDVNVAVMDAYRDIENGEAIDVLDANVISKMLPAGSTYGLYLKKIDLSQEAISRQDNILIYKVVNGKIVKQ